MKLGGKQKRHASVHRDSSTEDEGRYSGTSGKLFFVFSSNVLIKLHLFIELFHYTALFASKWKMISMIQEKH